MLVQDPIDKMWDPVPPLQQGGQNVRFSQTESVETLLQIQSFNFPPDPPDREFMLPDHELIGEVLGELRTLLDQIRLGYSDPAERELAWEAFRKIVSERLWAACEPLEEDEYKQQLADQLDIAVSKIESHQLQPEHLKAIALTLERLSSESVGANDVDDCEQAWRLSQVETLPSFSEILKDWEVLYRVGDDDEGAVGDDDATAPSSR